MSLRDMELWGKMGDGITPRQSPPGFPVNCPHTNTIAHPPLSVLPTPSRQMNKHHGNTKWEGEGFILFPHTGAKWAQGPNTKDAPGD